MVISREFTWNISIFAEFTQTNDDRGRNRDFKGEETADYGIFGDMTWCVHLSPAHMRYCWLLTHKNEGLQSWRIIYDSPCWGVKLTTSSNHLLLRFEQDRTKFWSMINLVFSPAEEGYIAIQQKNTWRLGHESQSPGMEQRKTVCWIEYHLSFSFNRALFGSFWALPGFLHKQTMKH